MTRMSRSCALLWVFTLTVIPVAALAAPPPPPVAHMSIRIASVQPTTVTARHGAVTFRLKISGIVLDAKHIGKANVRDHGHLQIYANAIPKDAYKKKELKTHWLASLAAPNFGLNLLPAILGGKGKHKIFIALAQNNDLLYNVRPATATITAS